MVRNGIVERAWKGVARIDHVSSSEGCVCVCSILVS